MSALDEPGPGPARNAQPRVRSRSPTRRRCVPGTPSCTSAGSRTARCSWARWPRSPRRSSTLSRRPRAGAASTSAAASARRPSGWPSSSDRRASRSAPTPRRGSSRTPAARPPRPGVENVEFEIADAQTAEWEPDLRLRLLAHGHPVLRRTGSGDARDPRRAQARRQARQDLLAAQGREPVLGGDRAGSRAVPLAPRGVRGRHLRAGTVLARQPRDHARHPRGRRVRRDRAAPARLRLLHGRGHGRGDRSRCSRSDPAPS